MKKKGLGKGLGALIREDTLIDETNRADKLLPVSVIRPKANQPRRHFDEEAMKELATSIAKHGLIQPIAVRKTEDCYEIIAGERRYRASIQAGLDQIPVRVLEVDDPTADELSLIENIQREDLNPIEEALAYQSFMKKGSFTQEETAKELGKSRSYIANTIRLLKLEEEIQEHLILGNITSSQGRALLGIESGKKRIDQLNRLLLKKANVRDLEKKAKKREKDIFVDEMEERLSELLMTRVHLTQKKKGGKIEIEYYNNDDLERLIDRIEGENYE